MSQASTIATLLASTGSIVGGGAGIWWVTKSINDAAIIEQQESRYDMPEDYRTLDTDQDFNSATYKNKYGGIYGKYLIGVHKTSKDNQHSSKNNDSWWDWAFKKYQISPSTKGKFARITKSTGENSSLQLTCKSAYLQSVNEDKSTSEKIKADFEIENIKGDEYLESDIWKFCSIIGVKPVTLSEYGDKYSAGTRGAPENTSDRKSFISVDSKRNKQFWEYQDKMLKNGMSESSDKFFHPLKDKKTIQEICRMAFGTPIVPETGKNQDTLSQEIEKYCKLSNTNDSLRTA